MKLILSLCFLFFVNVALFSQDSDQQLAEHYYSQQEFDKALVYYQKLHDQNPNKFFFNRLIECLEATGDDKEVEKLLKKMVDRNAYDLDYPILLAQWPNKLHLNNCLLR